MYGFIRRALLVAYLAVLIPNAASAYYAAHMGRFTSRDPAAQVGFRIGSHNVAAIPRQRTVDFPIKYSGLERSGGYVEGHNLYEYVRSGPVKATDPSGLWETFPPGGIAGLPNPGVPGDWQKPLPPITVIKPLPSNSPECNKYPCDDTYRGTSLRCFCKCAGDSPWSQFVRGCLRELADRIPPPHVDEAHATCYELGDQVVPGGRPDGRLVFCWFDCLFTGGSINPPVIRPF